MKPIRVLSLFDGISAGMLALHNLNIPVACYDSSEIDDKAIKISQSNWPFIKQVGDITKLHVNKNQYDLILCGFPCQDLSKSGLHQGLNGKNSKLFWEFVRILKECEPRFYFVENNKGMKKEYEDIITKTMNVNPIFVPASILSAVRRDRLYWTNISNNGLPKDRNILLNSIIGDYDGIWVYKRGTNPGGIKSYKNKMPTVTCSCFEHNFFPVQNGIKRQFTVNEIEIAMGFPKNYTQGLSNSQRIKKIGNSWCIPVIEYLLKELQNIV